MDAVAETRAALLCLSFTSPRPGPVALQRGSPKPEGPPSPVLTLICLSPWRAYLADVRDVSSGQKGAVTGGALGTGIGVVAGGNFGRVGLAAGLAAASALLVATAAQAQSPPTRLGTMGFVWRCLAGPCCLEDG